MVRTVQRVEGHHIDTRWRETRQVKIVWYNKLVIFWQAPLESNPLRVLIKARVRLVRPREKEPVMSLGTYIHSKFGKWVGEWDALTTKQRRGIGK